MNLAQFQPRLPTLLGGQGLQGKVLQTCNPESHTPKATLDLGRVDIEQVAPEEPEHEITTLMVQNLPRCMTQPGLLEQLNQSGFGGLYDFCFMPRNFGATESQGFAFVNFTSALAAAAFKASWQSRQLQEDKTLNVVSAKIQGLQANLNRWSGPRMKRIRNPDHKPFVPEHCLQLAPATLGKRRSLPAASEALTETYSLKMPARSTPAGSTPFGRSLHVPR